HHLESLFDQFRSQKRTLDRPALDLTFRCLDELRDYHRDLRAQGQSAVDLSGLTARVDAYLHEPPPAAATEELGSGAVAAAVPDQVVPSLPARPAASGEPSSIEPGAELPASLGAFEDSEGIVLTVVFEPHLPLADMKARLVHNRLSAKARVLATDPP